MVAVESMILTFDKDEAFRLLRMGPPASKMASAMPS